MASVATEEAPWQQKREHGVQLKQVQPLQQVQSRCSTPSFSGSAPYVAVGIIADHVSCGVCAGPVASSLLLSCSHLFCGSCLFTKLQQKPSCPTCKMDLRAIPMRCLAMDKVAASVVPSLTTQQQQQYSKRKQDGQCVADQVNKMFHYLAPSTALTSSTGVTVGAVAPSLASGCLPAFGQIDITGSTAINPIRSNYPGPAPVNPHLQQQPQQYSNQVGVPFGSFPASALAAGSAAPNLMQLAAAQHLQMMQQQLTALNVCPAAAATGAGAHIQYRPTGGDHFALQQSLIRRVGNSNGSLSDLSPLAAGTPAVMAGNDMQSNTTLGSMCHV